MEQNVIDILKKVLELDENISIHADDKLKKYGLDSVSLVRVVLELETLYEIEIGDEDLKPEHFKTVASICLLLQIYLDEKDKR